jgi:predicted acylesterase/phospholipase RssA
LGAYEAGAFDTFVKNLPPIEVAYDFLSGVSAGALNAGAIALFAQGEEIKSNDFL